MYEVLKTHEPQKQAKEIQFAIEFQRRGYEAIIQPQTILSALCQEIENTHPDVPKKEIDAFMKRLEIFYFSHERPKSTEKLLSMVSNFLKIERRRQHSLPQTPLDNIVSIQSHEFGTRAVIDLQILIDQIQSNNDPLSLTVDHTMPAEYVEKLLKQRVTIVLKMLIATLAASFRPQTSNHSILERDYAISEERREKSKSAYIGFVTLEKFSRGAVALQLMINLGKTEMSQAEAFVFVFSMGGLFSTHALRKSVQAPADSLENQIFKEKVKEILGSKMPGEQSFVTING